jgi:DNA-binding GntR family transcriptional regulator
MQMTGPSPQLSDHAYQILRRKLILCELEPGSWISEADLQGRSGVPRTPTREATTRLVHEHMLVLYPRRGYRVSDITVESAIQLFDVFEPLLALASSNARGNVDPAVLESLESLISQPPPSDGTARNVVLLDVTDVLLPAILEAAGNPWLTDTALKLFAHVERLWNYVFTDESLTEIVERGFRPILDHLKASSDTEGAAALNEGTSWVRDRTLQAINLHLRHATATSEPW